MIDEVGQIVQKNQISTSYGKPDDPICVGVIDCLDAFSDASKGRYANFEAIGNPAFDSDNEPVNKWWSEVVEPILDRHYRGRKGEAIVRSRAKIMDSMLGQISFVMHTNEEGIPMFDFATASERSGQTKWAQKYGRYYTLVVVRWLAGIFSELVREACYTMGIDSMFGHYEFFSTFVVEDRFLLTRRMWPLR